MFIIDAENLKLCRTWIENGKITVGGTDLKCELTNEHKYSVIKTYCASKAFTDEEKASLQEKVFAGDDTDKAKNVKEVCDYIYPKAELKA